MRLPDFPWDRLAGAKATASAAPGGIVDLSVGTPVDPTPAVVQQALAAATDAPGYPTTQGILELREAICDWLARRAGVTLAPTAVLPLIGTKEFVAWLPTLLGVESVDYPEIAYPTYEVGALIAGVPRGPGLTWLNSPSNPTGAVMTAEQMRAARGRGIVASDECYFELAWDAEPVSVLHPDVCDGDHTGLLAVHSLSKRSNLAGYRSGFVGGDPALIAQLLEVRKHVGMMMPMPVQMASTVAWLDDAHVVEQRERYAARRAVLREALTAAGFRIDHSQAGLYLWVTRDEPCWDTVNWLAARGILVAPGDFYGAAGARHVRVALTATDEAVQLAYDRLAG